MNDLYARDFAPLECNVYARDDGNVHEVWTIPTEWLDSYILMGAYDGAIFVLFGYDNAVIADPNDFSANPSGTVLMAAIETPARIPQNTVARIWVPGAVNPGNWRAGPGDPTPVQYFGIIGDNADAKWWAHAITEYHWRDDTCTGGPA
jgi:hypothetical protein